MQPVAERPGMRAQLRGGGPERVGGLLQMTALNPAAATGAMADPNPEPGHHRDRVGQLGLELLSPPVEHHPATAVRAAGGQRRLQLPIDTGRNGTVTVAAMRLTRLPAWRLRLQHRVPLRERGRLPLPPTLQPLDQLLQLPQPVIPLSQASLQVTHPAGEASVLRFELLPSRLPHNPGLPDLATERGGPSRTARSNPAIELPSRSTMRVVSSTSSLLRGRMAAASLTNETVVWWANGP